MDNNNLYDIKQEELLNQINDTIVHKKYVLESCHILAKYLILKGKREIAIELLKRACVHDLSKFENDELSALANISNDMSLMKSANSSLSPEKKLAIELHWENNTHHPEYYKSANDMTELDIMEMVCDWHARSMQYDTNLIEFVKKRNEDRFHFEEKMFKKILRYCNILVGNNNLSITKNNISFVSCAPASDSTKLIIHINIDDNFLKVNQYLNIAKQDYEKEPKLYNKNAWYIVFYIKNNNEYKANLVYKSNDNKSHKVRSLNDEELTVLKNILIKEVKTRKYFNELYSNINVKSFGKTIKDIYDCFERYEISVNIDNKQLEQIAKEDFETNVDNYNSNAWKVIYYHYINEELDDKDFASLAYTSSDSKVNNLYKLKQEDFNKVVEYIRLDNQAVI